MKVIRTSIIAMTIVALISACGGEKKHSEDQTTWAAMDSYHMLMAEAYHPLKDSANLAPAKAGAEALAMEAEKWASGTLPEKVDNDDMKKRIESLKTASRAFADQVKAGATDEELSAALTALHEEFHHIMEAWEGGHDHH